MCLTIIITFHDHLIPTSAEHVAVNHCAGSNLAIADPSTAIAIEYYLLPVLIRRCM